ncbi:LuxR C-terminal-related transcriptional regulator [Adlercreutzia sp. ZJ304]|uniref:helix-turn-helix transcriptional regulator n=1 Tax=Adlercreutzia sp. ZJ304 TaxID=2709791 RepID=UPI001F152F87|nr:LuxR C-terminal-related transcriptional regulator [Adlercreutzia sp. ZJ304]
MERLVDSSVMWIICFAFMGVSGTGEFSIVGALISLVTLCAAIVIKNTYIRGAVLILSCAICAAWAPALPFLPVVVGLSMFEHTPVIQAAGIIACAFAAIKFGATQTLPLLALCVASIVLAIRTSHDFAAKRGMRISRDVMREQMIDLSARNYTMEKELEKIPADYTCEENKVDPLENLTDRERQIATLVAEGMDNREIAEQLFLSEGTVRNNISSILAKKQLKNRTQLAVLCLSK